mmetsp:Transcript_14301/g.45115  ORF Transcript_14301/g.45115 Transcript_14301/m.45115 type:complete len:156 (+) Transcript_14301:79-546(+)
MARDGAATLDRPLLDESAEAVPPVPPKAAEASADRTNLVLFKVLVACAVLITCLLAGICIFGARMMGNLHSDLHKLRSTTDDMYDEMRLLTNRTDELVYLTGLIHEAILNTTRTLYRADRHARNIVDNTYEMCNVLTLGTEKEEACHNDIGYTVF